MSNVDYKRVLGTTAALSQFFERDPRDRDANTSDSAAFDVAKDGQKAIDALNGAAEAERRRILKSKRKHGGAFAFAGSF